MWSNSVENQRIEMILIKDLKHNGLEIILGLNFLTINCGILFETRECKIEFMGGIYGSFLT